MIFDEIPGRSHPAHIVQATSSRDLMELFPETAPVDDLVACVRQPAYDSNGLLFMESNLTLPSTPVPAVRAVIDSRPSQASWPVVDGTYAGDVAFKNKIDFKTDMSWPERARVKQILTGQASELSHQQQIEFLHAHGIDERHELWAMYKANSSS